MKKIEWPEMNSNNSDCPLFHRVNYINDPCVWLKQSNHFYASERCFSSKTVFCQNEKKKTKTNWKSPNQMIIMSRVFTWEGCLWSQNGHEAGIWMRYKL